MEISHDPDTLYFPVSDADAARLVSRDALAEVAEQIVATPVLDNPARRAASPRAASGPARRRRFAAPVAGRAAAAAIAAGVLASHGHSAPAKSAAGPRFGRPDSAAQLVDYATLSAAAGPTFNPRPHQWIYTDVLQATSSAGTGGYLAGPPDGRLNQKTWIRVDFQEHAYLKNGKLVIAASNVPRSAKSGKAVEPVPFGWPSVSYAYLNSTRVQVFWLSRPSGGPAR